MRGSSPSLAWLARPGGSVVVGHGPFVPAASPPPDGTAFFVQDFGLGDPLPWKIPARVEEVAAVAFRA
nr:hypothetical protein [Akkermansiaceae bacterium]